MRNSLAFFFLTCSLILVLGHSILPHNHVAENHCICRICDVKNPSLGDIIKHTLSHDLGINHLEEYENFNLMKIATPDFHDVILIKELLVFSFIIYHSVNENFPVVSSKLTSQYFSLRGPPIGA